MARIYTGGLSTSKSSLSSRSSSKSAKSVMALGSFSLIDLRAINDFYADLKYSFGRYAAVADTMGMFVDSHGKGIYTYSGARLAKALLLESIDSGGKAIGANWPELSDEQIDLQRATGYKSTHWKFRGNVYRNVVARKKGKGYEVGLKSKMVRTTGFRTNALRPSYGAKINVQRYAAWVEYGTKWMKPRPLFSKMARYYSAKVAPDLNKIVSDSVKRIAKSYKIKKVSSKTATGSFGSAMSASTMKSSTGIMDNPDKDFSGEVIQGFLKDTSIAGSGYQSNSLYGKAGLSSVNTNNDITKKDFNKLATKLGVKGKLAEGRKDSSYETTFKSVIPDW